jgi:hypothetical protein
MQQPVHVPARCCWLHHLAGRGRSLAHANQAANQSARGLQGQTTSRQHSQPVEINGCRILVRLLLMHASELLIYHCLTAEGRCKMTVSKALTCVGVSTFGFNALQEGLLRRLPSASKNTRST